MHDLVHLTGLGGLLEDRYLAFNDALRNLKRIKSVPALPEHFGIYSRQVKPDLPMEVARWAPGDFDLEMSLLIFRSAKIPVCVLHDESALNQALKAGQRQGKILNR